jgi:hypothetical protein
MIIDGTNGLTFNNATTQASAGKVIQIVTAQTTTTYSTSSTSWTAATNFAVTITPKFSTSTILVIVAGGMADINATTPSQMALTIYRNSTNLAPGAGGNDKGITEIYGASSRIQVPIALSVSDSPATTSATTYTVYYRSSSGYTVLVNNDNTQATIIAMEIGA